MTCKLENSGPSQCLCFLLLSITIVDILEYNEVQVGGIHRSHLLHTVRRVQYFDSSVFSSLIEQT